MTNTYTKIGAEWAIRCKTAQQPGATVTVTTRAGAAKQVTLGRQLAITGGEFFYAIAETPAPAAQPVGDLSRIVAMFDRAKAHLKYPAIVLEGFRVSVAGDRAKEPGSLTLTSIERNGTDKFGRPARDWYGRVSTNGTYQPARTAPADLGDKLRRFAADPVGEAGAFGKLTGRCCFCNKALGEGEDQRSVEVGYGPKCADRYGLPWGETTLAPLTAADNQLLHEHSMRG